MGGVHQQTDVQGSKLKSEVRLRFPLPAFPSFLTVHTKKSTKKSPDRSMSMRSMSPAKPMHMSADAALESPESAGRSWFGSRRRSTISRGNSGGEIGKLFKERRSALSTNSEMIADGLAPSPRTKMRDLMVEADLLRARIAELQESQAEAQERARLLMEAVDGEASLEALEELIRANYRAHFPNLARVSSSSNSSSSSAGAYQVGESPGLKKSSEPEVTDPSFSIPELPTLKFSVPNSAGTRALLAGSPNEIVSYLINWNTDRDFVLQFFLFFRQFMTCADLLHRFVEIYDSRDVAAEKGTANSLLYVQPLPGSSTVSQRICYLLNRWMEDHYDTDLDPDKSFRDEFAIFAGRVDASLMITLDAAVTRAKEGKRSALRAQGVSLPTIQHVAQNLSFASLLSPAISPSALARMLTLIEARLFLKLEEIDFLKASKEDRSAARASPVQTLTRRFNDTASWIASEIVTLSSAKERGRKIMFFIEVAQEAFEMHNFNLLMTVLAGLNFSAVQRLKKSWKAVPGKRTSTFQELEDIMSSAKNYEVYRTKFRTATTPKMPYFGVFLRDLHFLDLANSTWIGDDKSVVDFGKLLSLRSLLDDVVLCQGFCDYQFPIVEKLQGALLKLPYLDEEWLHQRSVEAEPIQNTGGVNYLEGDTARPQSGLLKTVRKSIAFVKGASTEDEMETPLPEPDWPGRVSVVESEEQGDAAPKRLLMAALRGDDALFAELLCFVSVNAEDSKGDTALHMAAHHGLTDVVRVLIAAKAEIDAMNNDGWTPLAYALKYQKSECITALLAAGAQLCNVRPGIPVPAWVEEDKSKTTTTTTNNNHNNGGGADLKDVTPPLSPSSESIIYL